MQDAMIHDISDTALWSAVYRFRESERPDGLFRDPFAGLLAGERGVRIAGALPFHEKNAWAWVTRTYLFDKIIREQVAQGVDTVLNLAAGLDTRPFRMAFPASLRWIEVDLPQLFAYKAAKLAGAQPCCTLERVPLDLSNAQERRNMFSTIAQSSKNTLVLSEGLLIYLTRDQVAELASDLAAQRAFHHWAADIASPGLLEMLRKNTSAAFDRDVPELKFAPPEGPTFFERFGWSPLEVHSTLKTAARLRRLTALFRLFALFPEDPVRRPSRPWSATCLFARAGEPSHQDR